MTRIEFRAVAVCLLFGCAMSVAGESPRVPPNLAPVNTPGLGIDVRVGVGGAFTWSLPIPVVLTMDNKTGGALDLNLQVEWVTDAERGDTRIVMQRDVFLASPSRLRTRFCVNSYVTGNAAQPDKLLVRLRGRGRILWRRVVVLSSVNRLGSQDASALHLLAVDRKRIGLRYTAWNNRAEKLTAKSNNKRQPAAQDCLPLPRWRRVECVEVNAWELPDVTPPLSMFHALVFSRDSRLRDLVSGQVSALANYIRAGGCVVIPRVPGEVANTLAAEFSESVRKRIRRAAQNPVNGLVRVPVFCGLIIISDIDLFADDEEQAREDLALMVASRDEPCFPRYLDLLGGASGGLPPNASWTMVLVGFIFVVYALMTGPVVWFFFRSRGRRVLAWYVVLSVGVFSLASLLMGPALEMKPGDLEWLSVTVPTQDGGMQWGILTMTSAGARKYHLGAYGKGARAWMFPADILSAPRFRDNWYYGYLYGVVNPLNEERSIPVLALQPEVMASERNLELPPWGNRMLLFTAQVPRLLPLPVVVTMRQGTKAKQVSVTVRNRYPFTLHGCKLVVGIFAGGKPSRWSNQIIQADFYQAIDLGEISPGAQSVVQSRVFKPGTSGSNIDNCIPRTYSFGSGSGRTRNGHSRIRLPRLNYRERVYALLVCQVENPPPGLVIGPSDFTVYPGTHYIVQPVEVSGKE